MEQFSLEKWLKDKSRKIYTRDGRPVRIICWDKKDSEYPIVGLVFNKNGLKEKEGCCSFAINGKAWGDYFYDLFFADEELTGFEKELQTIISEASYWTSEDGSISTYCQFGDKEIKKISAQVLDLARKEIREEQQEKLGTIEMPIDVTEPYYIKGKQDVLKDLPKWKKAKKDEELDCHVAIQQDDRVVLSDFVQKDEYYITLDVLKTLPKEE